MIPNSKIVGFAELLQQNAEIRGLISPKDQGKIFERHILNSLCLEPFIQNEDASLIDIGSGAGLPGVPLAINFPDLSVTLIESKNRRVEWLEYVKKSLVLDNVKIIGQNSKELVANKQVQAPKAKYLTARAVAPLDRLIPLLRPFAADNFEMLFLKGKNAAAEIAAAESTLGKYGYIATLEENCLPERIEKYGLNDEQMSDVKTNVVRIVSR